MKKILVTLSAILIFATVSWGQNGSQAPEKHAKHHHGKHHKAHSHKS